MENYS